MFNTYFDMAFTDFYNKWVIRQIILSDSGCSFFEKLNRNSSIREFMSFFEQEKSKIELQDKFNSLYTKEYVKSFVLYLYKNVPEILKNKKEVNKEEYDLIWLSSFFDRVLEEYYLDIEEYKKTKIKSVESFILSLESRKEGKSKIKIDPESIIELKEDSLKKIDKVLTLEKVDFVLNGKYSNQELLKILKDNKGYNTYLPVVNTDFLLSNTVFYNIFKYPLKDYLLFMEYLTKISFKYGKEHLQEYYNHNGSDAVQKKYKKQYDNLYRLVKDILKMYEEDELGFVFHDIDLTEIYDNGKKCNSDDFFYDKWWVALYTVKGVGAIYANFINSPYFQMFYDDNMKIENAYLKKEEEKFKEEVKKNPKSFIDFLTDNKLMKLSSSFAFVLGDKPDWDKEYKKCRKEAEEEIAQILKGD